VRSVVAAAGAVGSHFDDVLASRVQPKNNDLPTVNKIQCGVAGVGSLGQHHARIYASLPGAELAGIYETSDARAGEICAKHGCRRFATID
jgi:hypothetical protein